MIRDLRSAGNNYDSADIVIVGGGTVGLVLGAKLIKNGLSVIVIESGGIDPSGADNALNDVTHLKTFYSGASDGRFRGLGGTSTRWGGALIPFLEGDLRRDWPIEGDEVWKYVEELEQIFSLPKGPYQEETMGFGGAKDYVTRSAKWPSFGKRNVAKLLDKTISSSPNLQVWVNATVTKMEFNQGTIETVTASSPDGSRLSVKAKHVVLAAGAIENTRLILQLNFQLDYLLFGEEGPLGRYFSDHLSFQVAKLKVKNLKEFNRIIGYRFDQKGTMRNIRFEMSNDSGLRERFPPHFFHISFQAKEQSGFFALREVMRNLQLRRIPSFYQLFGILRSSAWLTKALWWRYFERRLLIPSDAEIQVHLVVEQEPNSNNRITLSKTALDQFGCALPEIYWDISENDIRNISEIAKSLVPAWHQSLLSPLAQLEPLLITEILEGFKNNAGIYHPTGSTRMGLTDQNAVIDAKLRVMNTINLSAISTANLPSGGGANPTMMELLLGLRLTDRLLEDYVTDNTNY